MKLWREVWNQVQGQLWNWDAAEYEPNVTQNPEQIHTQHRMITARPIMKTNVKHSIKLKYETVYETDMKYITKMYQVPCIYHHTTSNIEKGYQTYFC